MRVYEIRISASKLKTGDHATHLLLPMSMMTMLDVECCRASSSHEVRWLNVSRLAHAHITHTEHHVILYFTQYTYILRIENDIILYLIFKGTTCMLYFVLVK